MASKKDLSQRILDSSFLDGKLQLALNKSYVVQSQLKDTVLKLEEPPTSNKTRAGRVRRSNTIERMVDRSSVVMGRLLLETEIKSTVKSFLGPRSDKLLDMLVTKIIRMRPIIPKESMTLDEQGAASIYKENVLYAAGPAKATQSDESLLQSIPDLTDMDKLRSEIADLEQQKQVLTKDLTRCQTFLYHSRTSDNLLYYYYAERLHFARICYEQSKSRSISGNYLSKMFDLKCQQLKSTEDMTSSLTIANTILTHIRFNLLHEVQEMIQDLLHNDRQEFQRYENELETAFAASLATIYDEESRKLRQLDERLVKTIQTVKYLHSLASSVEFTKSIKQMSQELAMHDSKCDRAHQQVNYEDLYNREVLHSQKHFRSMYKDVQECMERCYRMASQRVAEKRQMLQTVLEAPYLAGTAGSAEDTSLLDEPGGGGGRAQRVSRRMRECALEVLENDKYRGETLLRDSRLRQGMREDLSRQHQERMNGIQDLLNQQRTAYTSQLKARMGSLYSAMQSRSKRHSFTFSNYSS